MDSSSSAAHTTEPRRPRVTALVTTYNEAHNIVECLSSLLWCDEILVVDSYSTDATPELVQGFERVRFFQHTYYGAGAQKNWALDKVETEWVLVFDADERCTPELRDEIEQLLASEPKHDAYTINRTVYFLGKPLRFSGWQHDRVSRLFRHGTAYYQKRRVHSLLQTSGEAPILNAPMLHHMVEISFYEYAQRMAKYGWWGAAQCWREGKKSSITTIVSRTAWRFVRTYIFQLGVLDGGRGIVFCFLQSYATFMKWAILWSWHINSARDVEPDLPHFDDEETTWSGLDALQEGSRSE